MPPYLLPPAAITSLDEYLATDVGGLGVARAQSIGPSATIDLLTRSGLRGRGGGGFPTGVKWAAIAGQDETRRYVVCNGAEWFRSMGTDESPGNVVATVVGDVVAPDVGEIELGTPLRQVIDLVGSGLPDGRSVKAVFSGVANPVVTAADLDAPVSYEGMVAIGSGMGAAGFIVYDDTTCMVDTAYRFSRFLSVESCGQCPPCKLGSSAITYHLQQIETGAGTDDDVAGIAAWLARVTDGNRCFLAVEERTVVRSILAAFPDELARHVELDRCPRPRRLPIPKLLDLADGKAVYDESFWRKRPDWTYEPE